MLVDGDDLLARLGVPNFDRMVGAGGGHPLPVRTERNAAHPILVLPQREHVATRFQIPNSGRLIVAGAN